MWSHSFEFAYLLDRFVSFDEEAEFPLALIGEIRCSTEDGGDSGEDKRARQQCVSCDGGHHAKRGRMEDRLRVQDHSVCECGWGDRGQQPGELERAVAL